MTDKNAPRPRPSRRPAGGADDPPGATWDRRYAEAPWPEDADANLVARASGLAPGRAIDLGCGPGRNAIWLAQHGWRVTGVDASAVGLEKARDRAQRAGVNLELVRADVRAFSAPPASADLVVVANLHLAPDERAALLERVVGWLAPGGHLFFTGHHQDSLGREGPPERERLYTEELVSTLLAGLSAEVSRHERPAGAGQAPLVDVVAWVSVPSARRTAP